ncbi:ankyrin repeat protein [Cooperia oncophora]
MLVNFYPGEIHVNSKLFSCFLSCQGRNTKDLLTIQKRTNVDENEHGTALHRAVQMGNAVMARNLLSNKSVWIDEEDGRGRTALHYAMEQDSFEVVEVLVNGGANLDCVDYHGTSACHLACKEEKIDAVRLLL